MFNKLFHFISLTARVSESIRAPFIGITALALGISSTVALAAFCIGGPGVYSSARPASNTVSTAAKSSAVAPPVCVAESNTTVRPGCGLCLSAPGHLGGSVAPQRPASFLLALNPGAGDSAGEYAPEETVVPSTPSTVDGGAVPKYPAPPPAWELFAQDNGCSDEAFELIHTAAAEYQRDDVDMACLLACIAYYESTYRVGVKGPLVKWRYKGRWQYGHCTGLAQIHPCHRASMCKLGLDYDSELDRLRYACVLLTTALEFGGSLSDALGPWSPTRKRVTALYNELYPSEEITSGEDA